MRRFPAQRRALPRDSGRDPRLVEVDGASGSPGLPGFVELAGITFQGASVEPSHRIVWLVRPPRHQPLAVIMERGGEGGTSVPNAVAAALSAVEHRYPGHTAVLHWDDEPVGSPWASRWIVLGPHDPVASMEHDISQYPRYPKVGASLYAAGLL